MEYHACAMGTGVQSLSGAVYAVCMGAREVDKEQTVLLSCGGRSVAVTVLLRLNAIYMPLILLTSVGLGVLLKNKRLAALIAISYAVCFTGFCFRYFGNDYRESVGRSFCDGIGDAINKSVELSGGETTINVVAENMPYIYALFYTQTPPEEYLNTVEYENSGVMFQKVRSFSDFRFIEHTTSFHPEVAGIYIIDASLENIARTRTDEVYNFKNYSVAVIP